MSNNNQIHLTLNDEVFQDLIREKSNLQIKEMVDQKWYTDEIEEIDNKIKERGNWLRIYKNKTL